MLSDHLTFYNGNPYTWTDKYLYSPVSQLFLNQPGLGWLYVFNSFQLRLDAAASSTASATVSAASTAAATFAPHVKYLGQRIYRSGEMYWMTFSWLWPKVTAVAWISQKLLVCTIKFSNLGLCAACWTHFMRHHVSHPFSSLNSSLGLAGGKLYQKITIPIFRLVLQNFAIPGCFPYILFYCYLFSLLSSGWFVTAVCGSISVQRTS